MDERHQEDLFRQQAIRALSIRLPGRPICLRPRPWFWLSCLLVTLFVSCTIILINVEFSRTETARGWLIADRGIVRISHRLPAIVSQVVAHPGERVAAGEALLYLTQDPSLSTDESRSEAALKKLHREAAEIELQLDLLQTQSELDLSGLRQQAANTSVIEEALQSRRREQQRRLELSQRKLRQLQVVAREGAVSESEIIRQEEELAVLGQAMDQINQELASLRRERTQLANKTARAPGDLQIRLSSLRERRLQLSHRVAEHEARRRTVLHSPVAGSVTSVDVHAGYPVTAHQTLLTLLPENSQLAADVFVPSRAAGFIERGQLVRIAYDAFPRQQYGLFQGRVDSVSEYVSLPGEIPQTFSIREATYRARVIIDSEGFETKFGTARLRPGMLLRADFVLESRSLLEWLLEPLRAHRLRRT